MLQTAYLQPPANQSAEGPPDIRPAFVHTIRTVSKENSCSRRYGVIECDPLIRKGLEGTVSHFIFTECLSYWNYIKLSKVNKKKESGFKR